VERRDVEGWVERYERAWRSAGTAGLGDLFAADATYVVSPWATPLVGLPAIAQLWDEEREGPDETFAMTREIVAVDGDTAVVRLAVDYGDPVTARWRDLWVLRFDEDGRCVGFEEWPFAPGQPDGHG
jgi:ketosteroid isomerase-like protein